MAQKPSDDFPVFKEDDPDEILDFLTRPDNEKIDRNLVLRNAVRSGDWLIAEAQLNLGADISARDDDGMSALDYASPQMRGRLAAYVSERHTNRLKALRHHRRHAAPRKGLRP